MHTFVVFGRTKTKLQDVSPNHRIHSVALFWLLSGQGIKVEFVRPLLAVIYHFKPTHIEKAIRSLNINPEGTLSPKSFLSTRFG